VPVPLAAHLEDKLGKSLRRLEISGPVTMWIVTPGRSFAEDC
jgi:hypothetical protein